MKTKINFSKIFKVLLVAGLLAATWLANNAKAENQIGLQWNPYDTFTIGTNTYAYWEDPNNWTQGIVPSLADSTGTNYYVVQFSLASADGIICLITNDAVCDQLQLGVNGGDGEVILTNGASLSTGYNGEWTGVGFPEGPGMLIVSPGSSLYCGSHLWVGNGGAGNAGVVINDGGAIYIGGQLGLGWEGGSGDTNYMYLTNGGNLYLNQLATPTVGQSGGYGILNVGAGSTIYITNNYAGSGTPYLSDWTNDDQLISYGGLGTFTWSYSSADNLTTVIPVPPFNSSLTPVFSIQPTNNLVTIGGTVTLHALVSNVPVNYGWYFNGVAVANGSGISGANTANLTIAGITGAQTGSYSVYATNSNTGDSSYFISSSAASVSAQSFGLYPVVTLNGTVGNTYEVQYTSSLAAPVTWTTLGTYTTISSPQYVPDFTAPLNSSRFYQVVQTGTAQ